MNEDHIELFTTQLKWDALYVNHAYCSIGSPYFKNKHPEWLHITLMIGCVNISKNLLDKGFQYE